MQIDLDTIGAILAIAVCFAAVVLSFYATEYKKEESDVELLLSSANAKFLNQKIRKYSLAALIPSLLILVFWGNAIARVSPYLFGFLFLVCMITGFPILYRRGFGRFELTRFDMPRPIFARIGLALLFFFLVAIYFAGVEMAKERLHANQGVERDAKLRGALSVAVFRAPLTPNVMSRGI